MEKITQELPIGSIIMYSGNVFSIPDGWRLCDGTNETPDLRDRFIIGAGNHYPLNNTGGAEKVVLTVDQLPPHNHGYLSFNQVEDNWKSGGDPSPGNGTGGNIQNRTDLTGSGEPVSILPPYFALYFIIKVSN